MDSAETDCCRHDWQVYFDQPDAEACAWCGVERPSPLATAWWSSSVSA